MTLNPPGPQGTPVRRIERIALGFLCFMGLGLRTHALGRQSIWIDEAYSLELAGKSFSAIVAETARDNHPPLYYLLLGAWERMGSPDEAWARLLSAILGVALIAVFYHFCRQIVEPSTALLATALLTFSPFAVWHSQDARMYTLMLLTTYMALTGFLVALRRGTWWSCLAWVSSLVAAFYTHLYALFVIPVLLTYLLLRRRDLERKRMLHALAGIGIAVLAFLPWVAVVLTSASHEAGFYKPIGLLSIPYAFYAFSVGYSLGPSVVQLHDIWHRSDLLSHLGVEVVLAAVLFGVTFVQGLLLARRHFGRYAGLIASLIGFPVFLPVLVTMVTRIDFNARYAISAFPVYLLCVSAGIRSLPSNILKVLMTGGIAATLALSLMNYYSDDAYAKEDARSAFRIVASQLQPDDCLLVIGVHPAFRYYAGPGLRMEWLDFRSRARAAEDRRSLRQWAGRCSRLWFVSGREWEADPLGLARPTLEAFFRPMSEQELTGVRVLQMEPRTTEMNDLDER